MFLNNKNNDIITVTIIVIIIYNIKLFGLFVLFDVFILLVVVACTLNISFVKCEHRYSKTVLPFLNIRALFWFANIRKPYFSNFE